VEWDNEDPVKDTVEFVCHAVTIHYLPQLPDGTLGAAKQARRPLRLPLGRRQRIYVCVCAAGTSSN